jgi:MEMO1 family protein
LRVTRRPAVAGTFYEGTAQRLREQIADCYEHRLGPGQLPKVSRNSQRNLLAIVVPHAGYMYSGPVACHSYAELAKDGKPEAAVILGPNHTGIGSGVSIETEGEWITPLGKVEIETSIADEILKSSKFLEEDSVAQEDEHSVEVQVPMLQFLYNQSVKIVPIVIMLQNLEVCEDLSKAIAKVAGERNVIIIASSDFTHYEPVDVAKAKDKRALANIEELGGAELLMTVERNNITMCGPGPVATTLLVAKKLGAHTSQILKYSNSGEITGDMRSVVGYGAAKIARV